jgi:hypothetical protein
VTVSFEQRPYLSQAEIDEICEPLTSHAAQIRYLTREGMLVSRKPGGAPLLLRSELERVKGAGRFGQAQNGPAAAGPNVMGLQAWSKGRKSSGQKAQGR